MTQGDSMNPFSTTAAASSSSSAKKKRKRRNVCLASTAAAVILVVLILLILALTVFKAKKPSTTVNSLALDDLSVSFDIARLAVRLNLTLDVDLAIRNPNRVGFRYSNSSAALNYRGEQVGEVPIPAGRVGADSTTPMNLTLTLMADRLLSNSQLYSDVIAGSLRLNAFTRIKGKVSIMKIFKISVTSTTSCDITVFISNRTVGDQTCNYKTKL
ncbi:unnamed protein product [Linum trigynum]